MNLVLIGFGNVGQGFAAILRDKSAALLRDYGFEARIVGIAKRSQGVLYDANGLALDTLLAASQPGALPHSAHRPDLDVLTLIQQPEVEVVVELSPSNLQTAQPALSYCYAALEAGKHLVLANKGPVALDYAGLRARADALRLSLYYEATVMAGTPSLRLAQEALAGCTITRVRGILNGTTNYILTQMEQGMTYGGALKAAQDAGYAEADPAGDVEGWDAAGKLTILAAVLFGVQFDLATLPVSGITGITVANLQAAADENERWKLIAEATPDGGAVRARRIPLSDPLAGVGGVTNAITYTTDLLGDVTLIGAGAGRQATGFAILADLLALHRQQKR